MPTSSNKSDNQLLYDYAATGNADIFRELFDRFEPSLRRLIGMWIYDPHRCDDLLQEIFLRVHLYSHRFNGRSTARTWLMTIARNATFDALRRLHDKPLRKREHTMDFEGSCWADDALLRFDPPNDVFDERFSELFAAIDQLPPREFAVVRLIFFEEACYTEVGNLLQIPTGTVKSRLHRAVGHLRKILAENTLDDFTPAKAS
jgi:RNA polymerase sigma-70 factor (ECF subfamily)